MAELFYTDHEAFIKRLTDIVLANLQNENFGVEDLAREAGLSRSTLHRRLCDIKQQHASQFIREIRLKCAMELLQHHAGNASEIAYQAGFGSPPISTSVSMNTTDTLRGRLRKDASWRGESHLNQNQNANQPRITRKQQ
jgi:AraC-like DNA-binding protein